MDILLIVLFGYILISISTSYFLTIWFDGAKFFVEYIKLIGLSNKIPHIRNFLKTVEQGSDESYLDYIMTYKDNFLTRLVTCEKCFSAWVSAGFSIYFLLSVFFIFGKDYLIECLILSPLLILSCAFTAIKMFKSNK